MGVFVIGVCSSSLFLSTTNRYLALWLLRSSFCTSFFTNAIRTFDLISVTAKTIAYPHLCIPLGTGRFHGIRYQFGACHHPLHNESAWKFASHNANNCFNFFCRIPSWRLVQMMRLVGFMFTYVTLNCSCRCAMFIFPFFERAGGGVPSIPALWIVLKRHNVSIQLKGYTLIEGWPIVCTHYYDRDSWSLVLGFLCLTGMSHIYWFYLLLIPHSIQLLGFSSRSSHSPIYDKRSILWAQETSYVTLTPRVSLQPTTLRTEDTVRSMAITITLLLMAHHRPHTQVLLGLKMESRTTIIITITLILKAHHRPHTQVLLLGLMMESHQDIPVMAGKKMICRRLVIMMKRMHRGQEISVIRFVSKPIAPDSRATWCSLALLSVIYVHIFYLGSFSLLIVRVWWSIFAFNMIWNNCLPSREEFCTESNNTKVERKRSKHEMYHQRWTASDQKEGMNAAKAAAPRILRKTEGPFWGAPLVEPLVEPVGSEAEEVDEVNEIPYDFWVRWQEERKKKVTYEFLAILYAEIRGGSKVAILARTFDACGGVVHKFLVDTQAFGV